MRATTIEGSFLVESNLPSRSGGEKKKRLELNEKKAKGVQRVGERTAY